MSEHVQRVHLEVRYQCAEPGCDKSFATKSSLNLGFLSKTGRSVGRMVARCRPWVGLITGEVAAAANPGGGSKLWKRSKLRKGQQALEAVGGSLEVEGSRGGSKVWSR